MDENRIRGAARNFGGQMEEEAGSLAGDTQARLKGKMDQAAGTAQNLYGQTADAARDTASSLDDWFRRTIETQPYERQPSFSAWAGFSGACPALLGPAKLRDTAAKTC